ncbi:MAG: hypothetical protein N4A59_11555 [Marinifilum sp.]|jgi:hypothetical protein|nr:hypothetical protein [Marinifilum sp.]
MDNLSYVEKCNCESNNFCRFVTDLTDFSVKEKEHLTKQIVTGDFPKILYVSGVLAAWSVIAGIIDAILFPGIIIYAVFHGVVDYKVLTPPILFLTGNLFIKFVYISRSLKGLIGVTDIVISALPYAGSAYLLKKFLINDKLLARAVGLYLKDKKQQFRKHLLNFVRAK